MDVEAVYRDFKANAPSVLGEDNLEKAKAAYEQIVRQCEQAGVDPPHHGAGGYPRKSSLYAYWKTLEAAHIENIKTSDNPVGQNASVRALQFLGTSDAANALVALAQKSPDAAIGSSPFRKRTTEDSRYNEWAAWAKTMSSALVTCGGPGTEEALRSFYGDPPDGMTAQRHHLHNDEIMNGLAKMGFRHKRLSNGTQRMIEESGRIHTSAAVNALSVCEDQGQAIKTLDAIARENLGYLSDQAVVVMKNFDASHAIPVLSAIAEDSDVGNIQRGTAYKVLGYHGAVAALCDHAATAPERTTLGVNYLPDPAGNVLDEWKRRGTMPDTIKQAVRPQYKMLPSLTRHIRNKTTPDDAREWAIDCARRAVEDFSPKAWYATYENLPRMISDGEQALARLKKAQERGYPVDDVIAELKGKVSTLRRRHSGMRAHREREE
jgi:hypothetical protein